jgi:hypothetical protein
MEEGRKIQRITRTAEDPVRLRRAIAGERGLRACRDPRLRMHRILDLYDHPPDGGRVICVDEFGPLNLMPRQGRA